MGHDQEEEETPPATPTTPASTAGKDQQEETWNLQKQTLILELAEKLINGDLQAKIEAARDIRKVVRKSSVKTRSKFAAAGVIQPLVFMLLSPNLDAREASLLALLNLASIDLFVIFILLFRNKVNIVTAGAIPPLVELLKLQNASLRELATAAILTLSAAAPNKPTIAASGAAPLLVQILSSGSVQGKVDAVTALHNLSTCKENSIPILDAKAVSPLINLLKECKKYSKFAEKATALLEILSKSEEGRVAITDSDGGILTLVETVEDGSLFSTQHAVGALLSLCQSCREKYRELILKEGAIPGLLRLTVEGTNIAQERARTLLDLLRDTPQEKKLASSVLEKIVYDIATRVDGADKAAETAKRLLEDMVQRSMELSMNRIQHRAASCTPAKVPSGLVDAPLPTSVGGWMELGNGSINTKFGAFEAVVLIIWLRVRNRKLGLLQPKCWNSVSPEINEFPAVQSDYEWYYTVSMTRSFAAGDGILGRAFGSGSYVWLSGDEPFQLYECERVKDARTRGIQTLVYLSTSFGIVELGSSETIEED
ncbi:Armadillo [Corchorus olitorius]|uniref:Armadillo n=1 Tax=Corchorus olitorius TaxID=93759 RepID=A0A1R3J495_9ROSI|nr:Armadillo [Corchorus olitorius]